MIIIMIIAEHLNGLAMSVLIAVIDLEVEVVTEGAMVPVYKRGGKDPLKLDNSRRRH